MNVGTRIMVSKVYCNIDQLKSDQPIATSESSFAGQFLLPIFPFSSAIVPSASLDRSWRCYRLDKIKFVKT